MLDGLKDDMNHGALKKIRGEIERMAEITGKLMKITRYKTRGYIGDRKIIDIDRASL